MNMESLLGQYLLDLKAKVAQMAGLVEENIFIATKALAKKDVSLLERVFENEEKINEFHKDIDRTCFKLLARQSPVASDLRHILVSTRMAVDLERMGDLACSISYCVRDYFDQQPILLAGEIPMMSDLVRLMVRKGIDAFSKGDIQLAREVINMDDNVDEFRDNFSEMIKDFMIAQSSQVHPSLDLYTIVRNLERLGDHATNIAEEVIFLITGKDIRHMNGDVLGEVLSDDAKSKSNSYS